MKQIITLLFAAMVALIARADFTTLSFRTIGGDTHDLDISGLAISFSKDHLTASNAVTEISIPLMEMASMEFTGNESDGVGSIDSDFKNQPVSVYGVNGAELGAYPSFSEAMNRISSGIYLFRYNDGTTVKITKQ